MVNFPETYLKIVMLQRASSACDCMACHWPLVLLNGSVALLELQYRKPAPLIISTALDYPEAEAVWNPEAGVQLTPIESVISQDCQVGDALAAQDKRMLIQCPPPPHLHCLIFEQLFHSANPCAAGRVQSCLCRFLCQTRVQGSSTSSWKLRSQHKSEPTGTDCFGTSRLLQTRVDRSTSCPSFYLHNSPDSSLWTARVSNFFCLIITWIKLPQ